MPELTILSVDMATVRAAQKTRSVDATFADLWDDHQTCCFLCDAEIAARPYSVFMPDKQKAGHLVVLPLCPECAALPQMKRLNRCLKLLRAMWSRPVGPQIHFHR